MSENSKIEWTDDTWNFLVGCDKISAGCKNCYAIQTAWIRQHNPKMLQKFGGTVLKTPGGKLNWTGRVNVHESAFLIPARKKKPTMYFVNSMSDLFHEEVPFKVIDKAFAVMALSTQHTFQILTKRAKRMLEYYQQQSKARIMTELDLIAEENPDLAERCANAAVDIATCNLVNNIWQGVSVEDQKSAEERIPYLLQVGGVVRFLSCEPLLSPLDLMYPQGVFPNGPTMCCSGRDCGCLGLPVDPPLIHGINWVICGGESGYGARPMHPDWARSLRDQCASARVPFFFKQWGEYVAFEETAQQPFMRDCRDGKEYDGHQMNFIDDDGNDGKFMGGQWLDFLESSLICDHDKSATCMFLKVGKKAAGRLLDGVEHNEFPQTKHL